MKYGKGPNFNMTVSRDDFLPTANLAALRCRAELLKVIRRVFDDAGYFEVETPILSADIVVDAWLEPFVADFLPSPHQWSQPGQPRYLQTSPEFAMKRLLAAGATAIYQLGKVFRNGEIGQRHNPEFTMVEWYRVGDDHLAQMQFTETLVRAVFAAADEFGASSPKGRNNSAKSTSAPRFPRLYQATDQMELVVSHEWDSRRANLAHRVASPDGFERLTYDDAFEKHAACRVLTCDMPQLAAIAEARGLVPPPGLASDDRDGWLNWLLAELVEPNLGRDRPTFLYNYPASQAALARTNSPDGGPAVAERFELYIDGVELCNGYHELTDPSILRQRIVEQSALRSAAGLRPLPAESRLLHAMESGLPASSGNALGVDRLIMLALGATELSDVIAFPFDRA